MGNLSGIMKNGSVDAEPYNIGCRDHDDEEHDQDLVPAGLSDAEKRGILLRIVRSRTDAACPGCLIVPRVIVVFECLMMAGHSTVIYR
jgi:hypothetical protein